MLNFSQGKGSVLNILFVSQLVFSKWIDTVEIGSFCHRAFRLSFLYMSFLSNRFFCPFSDVKNTLFPSCFLSIVFCIYSLTSISGGLGRRIF